MGPVALGILALNLSTAVPEPARLLLTLLGLSRLPRRRRQSASETKCPESGPARGGPHSPANSNSYLLAVFVVDSLLGCSNCVKNAFLRLSPARMRLLLSCVVFVGTGLETCRINQIYVLFIV
jgi:hypothetical protein